MKTPPSNSSPDEYTHTHSGLAEPCDCPSQESVYRNDSNHDPHPLALAVQRVAIARQNRCAGNPALVLERAGIHARALSGNGLTCVAALFELVDHHALEDVGLIVNVVKHVLPERIEHRQRHQEAAHAHPQSVCTRSGQYTEYNDSPARTRNRSHTHTRRGVTHPLANAISASDTTKLGNRLAIKTTSDSAASRSRNNHMIHVKKAPASGRSPMSQ